MELKLNIYKGREVEKTYTADEFDIMFGTVEDLIQLIDFDTFGDEVNDTQFAVAAGKMVYGAFSQVKTLLKEIFPELTDEELKRVKVKEILPLLINLVKFSFAEIAQVGKGKN